MHKAYIVNNNGDAEPLDEIDPDLQIKEGQSIAIRVDDFTIINMKASAWNKTVVSYRVLAPDEITKALL